jgi:hypothetical protein
VISRQSLLPEAAAALTPGIRGVTEHTPSDTVMRAQKFLRNQFMVRNTGAPDYVAGLAAANVDNRSIIAGAERRIDETVPAGVKGVGGKNGPSGCHFYNLYNRLEGSGWSCLGRTKVIE